MVTKDNIDRTVGETLAWASEISEIWTGTLYEAYIDVQVDRIEANRQNGEQAYTLALDLAQTLAVAEREYDEYENS